MDIELLLIEWADRLRQAEPRALAILCQGSYARGAPEAHSDLDLTVLLDGEAAEGYRSVVGERADGRLLHVTVATQSLEEWLDQFAAPALSEAWAFFLPARQVARLLWAAPQVRARLESCVTLDLGAAPQLQDLLESAAKVRNAAARADELGVRLAAQDLALCCPALLALLGHPPSATSRRAALQAALELPAAPAGYREDLLACLGLSGRATALADIRDAALRLAAGVLAALRASPEALAGQVEAGLPEALADGRLMRLLTQR